MNNVFEEGWKINERNVPTMIESLVNKFFSNQCTNLEDNRRICMVRNPDRTSVPLGGDNEGGKAKPSDHSACTVGSSADAIPRGSGDCRDQSPRCIDCDTYGVARWNDLENNEPTDSS